MEKLFDKYYSKIRRFLKGMSPYYFKKFKTLVKFVVSGTTAATTDISLLYTLTELFKVHYLISSSIAFLFAFFISFYLQKFWTFRDNNTKDIYNQMLLYLGVGLVNLGINVTGMYFLVEKFSIWYLYSQVIMGSLISISSFVIYKFFIFKKKGKLKKLEQIHNQDSD